MQLTTQKVFVILIRQIKVYAQNIMRLKKNTKAACFGGKICI